MRAAMKTSLIGEIHCMNCGRTLADVVRDAAKDTLALKPARYQSVVQAVVVGGNTLRCKHCKGRAFIEPFDGPEMGYEGVRLAEPMRVA